LLLKERDALDDVILPSKDKRTPVMESSLRMLGLDPDGFRTVDLTRPLWVDELTVVETDRFRPELLRSVRRAVCSFSNTTSHRRIYISRQKAPRRHLVNRAEVGSLLKDAGFEKVFMEDLSFKEQVALMQEAAVIVAPHGAGLTNMMFCAPGTHVVEIADLGFPNPNFYALASAMDHEYWLVPAEGIGDEHPLKRDMRASSSTLREVLSCIPQ
jgi:capsular polysaccharide biosynthesis protein